ncbi:hypothetical protein LSH36_986g00013 [Paralvinella palmiformis]|uniref:Extracellular globin n=1 Tax=Paralvinella palmiformis TaxID=53620 RepID=A0AAD9IWF3_9ANNE|nr:hypothetical protein LSH36_986g00013 [Paralvinella palmiformis]
MKVLIIIAVCLAFVPACMSDCSPLKRLKLKSQWEAVYGKDSVVRENLSREIWSYILGKEPKMKELFTRVRGDNINSDEFKAHAVRVFGGFDICVSLMNDPDTLNAELQHLHDQHDQRGIPHEYFDIFIDALNYVIPNYLEHYDEDAWEDCFQVIKNAITEGLTE